MGNSEKQVTLIPLFLNVMTQGNSGGERERVNVCWALMIVQVLDVYISNFGSHNSLKGEYYSAHFGVEENEAQN